MVTTRKRFLQIVLAAPLAWVAGLFRTRTAAAAAEILARKPARPWETVEFIYERGGRNFPGTAVRLPGEGGISGVIYAACRICPHEGCVMGFETNYQLVGNMVGAEIDNPVFLCRCHLSVFDPARDGKVLSGPAKRAPWKFDIRERGEEIQIVGLEEDAGAIR